MGKGKWKWRIVLLCYVHCGKTCPAVYKTVVVSAACEKDSERFKRRQCLPSTVIQFYEYCAFSLCHFEITQQHVAR